MSPEWCIERMRWWHVEELLPIEVAQFPLESWNALLFWSELGQLDTRHYVVALDPVVGSGSGAGAGVVVGYAGLCDYPDEAFVQTLAVAPAVQGQGLGSRLLVALLEEATRRGQRTVSLEVRADNEPAQRLYARHGFTRTGVRRGYYPGGPDDSRRIDALVLTRRA